jgi:hypothetical protein
MLCYRTLELARIAELTDSLLTDAKVDTDSITKLKADAASTRKGILHAIKVLSRRIVDAEHAEAEHNAANAEHREMAQRALKASSEMKDEFKKLQKNVQKRIRVLVRTQFCYRSYRMIYRLIRRLLHCIALHCMYRRYRLNV